MKTRITILQTALPAYRELIMRRLDELIGVGLQVYTGSAHFDKTVQTTFSLGEKQKELQNRYFLERRFLIQALPWKELINTNIVIVDLNPRIISTWALLIFRKLLKRPSIIWGHAWPRKGRSPVRVTLRRILWWLADGILVYTETEAQHIRLMIGTRANKPVDYTNNALYENANSPPVRIDVDPTTFVYSGRLVETKKVGLLVDAFMCASLPSHVHLIVIGTGPLEAELRERAKVNPAGIRIEFMGEIHNQNTLSIIYTKAIASVSPGYVGLALIQSLWFGVPMIIADNEPHAPEIEAAKAGENAFFFSAGSVDSLSKAMERFYEERKLWINRRSKLVDECRDRYSVENMANSFTRIVNNTLKIETK